MDLVISWPMAAATSRVNKKTTKVFFGRNGAGVLLSDRAVAAKHSVFQIPK